MQISLDKKSYNATWVRIAPFWKEAVLLKYAESKLTLTWTAGHWGYVWQCRDPMTLNQQLLVHL